MKSFRPHSRSAQVFADFLQSSSTTKASHIAEPLNYTVRVPWSSKTLHNSRRLQLNPPTTIRGFHQAASRQALPNPETIASHLRAPWLLEHSSGVLKDDQNMQASAPEIATTAASTEGQPTVHEVFEPNTGTWQYVVADPATLKAVIIDPVLDFDLATQVISTTTADALLSLVKEKGYHVCMILETHAHADHLTAASYLRHRLGTGSDGHKPLVVAGQRIREMQEAIGEKYGVPGEEYINVFDKLFGDDETFQIGQLTAMAIHLPGHTPDHLGYKIGDNVFCGDSLFNADLGTARCDFPGGSARDLFKSGRKLLSMPDHFKIWTGHDYPSAERGSPVPYMTVRDHRAQNKHLRDGVSEDEFVALREERDAKLPAPRLLHQSLQVNIRTGQLPKPNEDGSRMLHVPLKVSGEKW
ncbi:hypothetical protein PG989_011607 [Apiospora arundinis]